MSNFRPIDRETGFLLPPSVDEWLPKTHLARFVVEGIDGLDRSAMTKSYRGSGSASYHPAVLLGIVVYGYATGVFSSRKLDRATYDSVAVRVLTANQHPDHDTLATFRRRFLAQIEGLLVQVLLVARAMGMLKLGTVALDGTKIHAKASRHSALSDEHATKIEAQLKAEVAELLAKAEAADRAGIPDGLAIPEELARREECLLIEWPPEEKEPTKYWLSTLPENIAYDRLVHLAKLRWRIERDYQELKQELGLGHYEGRGWRGFHHHATLCIAAYAFLVAERATIPPSGQREAPQRATSSLPAGYRPRGAPDPAGTPRGALDSERATQAYDSPGPPPRAMSLLPPEPRLHTHPVCDAVRLSVWMRDVLGASDNLEGFGQSARIERRIVTGVGAGGHRAQAFLHDHLR